MWGITFRPESGPALTIDVQKTYGIEHFKLLIEHIVELYLIFVFSIFFSFLEK